MEHNHNWKEYKLVLNMTEESFEDAINKLLAEGWTLYYGPVITASGNTGAIAQAMVR